MLKLNGPIASTELDSYDRYILGLIKTPFGNEITLIPARVQGSELVVHTNELFLVNDERVYDLFMNLVNTRYYARQNAVEHNYEFTELAPCKLASGLFRYGKYAFAEEEN